MMAGPLAFSFTDRAPSHQALITVNDLVIPGSMGPDRVSMDMQLEDLKALGLRRPATLPIYYRCTPNLVTTAESIFVLGDASTGEVESVVLQHAGRLWLSVGSDHTDRRVEAFDVAVAKQLCEKPVAPTWWAFDDIAHHWDRLIIRSFIGAERTLYQEGTVACNLDPPTLIARYVGRESLPEGTVMFCGTLPTLRGVRPASRFAFEVEDPILCRSIQHEYRITSLPNAD